MQHKHQLLHHTQLLDIEYNKDAREMKMQQNLIFIHICFYKLNLTNLFAISPKKPLTPRNTTHINACHAAGRAAPTIIIAATNIPYGPFLYMYECTEYIYIMYVGTSVCSVIVNFNAKINMNTFTRILTTYLYNVLYVDMYTVHIL